MTSLVKNQVMDNNERAIQEAAESLDQVFHHMHFAMLGLLRLQHYLNQAQAEGKGNNKGQANSIDKGGGKGKGKEHKGDGKGYGKAVSSHNLRILLIHLSRLIN